MPYVVLVRSFLFFYLSGTREDQGTETCGEDEEACKIALSYLYQATYTLSSFCALVGLWVRCAVVIRSHSVVSNVRVLCLTGKHFYFLCSVSAGGTASSRWAWANVATAWWRPAGFRWLSKFLCASSSSLCTLISLLWALFHLLHKWCLCQM